MMSGGVRGEEEMEEGKRQEITSESLGQPGRSEFGIGLRSQSGAYCTQKKDMLQLWIEIYSLHYDTTVMMQENNECLALLLSFAGWDIIARKIHHALEMGVGDLGLALLRCTFLPLLLGTSFGHKSLCSGGLEPT
jgi:hypothetical protein